MKLGYGGTKEEMKRLVNDASKLDKSVKANDMSFANIVKSIHTVQKNMGILGTTQKEAEKTITGSLNMIKSSWGNLLTAIGSGENLVQCFDNLLNSVEIFGNNVMPVAERALLGLGTVVEKLTPKIAEKLPTLATDLLPPLVKSATTLVAGLIKALPSIVGALAKEIPTIVKELASAISDTFGVQFPMVEKFTKFLQNNIGIIKTSIPIIAGLVLAFKSIGKINSISSGISSLFGKGGKGGSSGGLFSGMIKNLKSLAKTKPTVILKGMGNLAIILGGFTILTTAFMAVAPYISKLADVKTMVKMVGIVGTLGLVSFELVKFARIAGKIPISIVVKGLANMAIMIGGLSVLTLLIGAVSLLNFDYTKMFKLTALIGAVGTVGSALSLFAGIVGLIPIPVVLNGLANIALVTGGMMALIVAYGKLTEIKGFNEFISKGGATLANLYNQIGKIAGSLVGGLGEGITNSLPKIGANLSLFAMSLKPLFTMVQGVDMTGLGSFFKSMGSFMLQMAGEGILSMFTGRTDLSSLGTQLNAFATSSKGFFTKVAEFPENGFVNAKKLFDCLAGLKSLPTEGGVKGWFMGDINYDTLSVGLGKLASQNVSNFFNKVAEIKQEGFDKAVLLFDCLANLKSLPKEGGVVGWFTGKVNYDNIVAGMGALADEKMQNFFNMVGGLKPQVFGNIRALFESLASIKELPKEGGWWDNLTGTETSTLSGIATELGNFGEKTATFFNQINSLNLANLNGLWNSLNMSAKISTDISRVVGDNIDSIVEKVSKLPERMANGITSGGNSLSQSFVTVWTNAVKATVKPVNKLISGANWILKEFGSEKRVVEWTPYANGTNGHKGGNALVNDGRGAELVQMPNGKLFIPNGRNVFIPNAPKGMKVLSAEKTASLFGKKSPTYNYAEGTGNIDLWSYIDNPKGLINAVSGKYVTYDGATGIGYNIGKAMVTTISGEMTGWAKKLYDEMGAMSINAYIPSKGVEQWRTTVIKALKMEGQYSASNVARTLMQMQTESGGNPRAINLWDSNAKNGIPSKGLMQVIDPTFKAYARAGFDKNIYDPLSNILASIRYAVSRYGTLAKAYRGVGYANGGIATKPSIFGEDGAEMAIPLTANKRKRAIGLWNKTGEILGTSYTPESGVTYSETSNVENNNYSPQFNLTINGNGNDRETERKVKRWINEAMDEFFDSLARKSPRVQEV